MPTYDYVCTDCTHEFEHFQSMVSDPLSVCPECEGKLRRKIGAGGALIFKGSGFYCTDYKKPAKPDLDKKVDKAKDAAKSVKSESKASSSDSKSTSAA